MRVLKSHLFSEGDDQYFKFELCRLHKEESEGRVSSGLCLPMSFLGTEEQLLQRFQVIESNLLVIFKTESGFWELPFKPDCTSLQIQGTFAQLKLLTLNGILVEFKIIMEFVRKRKRWLAFVLFAKKCEGLLINGKMVGTGHYPLMMNSSTSLSNLWSTSSLFCTCRLYSEKKSSWK